MAQETQPDPQKTDQFIQAVVQARTVYNREPKYHPSLTAHPVYKEAPEIFNRPVNDWDLSDGSELLASIRDHSLIVSAVSFTDWSHRDKHGAATTIRPSSYYLDSHSNVIKLVNMSGSVSEINVQQYGIAYPQDIVAAETIDMRIAAGLPRQDISVNFSLGIPHQGLTKTQLLPTSDTDHIVVVAHTPSLDHSAKGRALQNHADFYLNTLLALDPVKDENKLDLEMDQIATATHRLETEEVGSIFHPRLIDIKLRAAGRGFIDRTLAKLIQNAISSQQELDQAKTAIKLIESEHLEYPVDIVILKKMVSSVTLS